MCVWHSITHAAPHPQGHMERRRHSMDACPREALNLASQSLAPRGSLFKSQEVPLESQPQPFERVRRGSYVSPPPAGSPLDSAEGHGPELKARELPSRLGCGV